MLYSRAPIDYVTLMLTERHWDTLCRIKTSHPRHHNELEQRLAEVERQLIAHGVRPQ